MKITVYSTTTCPACKTLKTSLEKAGLGYEEILLDQQSDKITEMRQRGGGSSVPFTYAELDNGEILAKTGFSPRLIEDLQDSVI